MASRFWRILVGFLEDLHLTGCDGGSRPLIPIYAIFGLGSFIVEFAKEFLVFHKVEFIARVQLTTADDAGKAVQVIDVVLSASHNI